VAQSRYDFKGFDLSRPINRLHAGMMSVARNVRAYLKGMVVRRTFLSGAVISLTNAIQTVARLNDTTPLGPSNGYVYITKGGDVLYCGTTAIATGLSVNPVSLVPFRPNTSVQPWMYVSDSAAMGSVTITTKKAIDGTVLNYVTSGMLKVRSDGRIYRMGIKEPQNAPVVGTSNTTVSGVDTLYATDVPWTNYGDVNTSYNYGQTEEPGSTGAPTAPVIIPTPTPGATVIITVTGSATVNGATATPSTTQANTSSYPGYFVYPGETGSTSIIIGAFTDADGTVITGTVAVPNPVNIGAGGSFTVPSGATQLQIGIDSSGNSAANNSGSFTVDYSVTTSAVTATLGTYGSVVLYYWWDSSTSQQVGVYGFKNPNDGGTATSRTSSTAAGTATGNSWIIDATITLDVPQLPGLGTPTTVPQWSQVNTADEISSTLALMGSGNTNGYYRDFNCCLVGSLFVPTDGNYTFVLTSKDSVLWGIDGAEFVSGTGEWVNGTTVEETRALTSTDFGYYFGQKITTVDGIDLLPNATIKSPSGSYYTLGAQSTVTTVTVTLKAGTHSIEIDWDYWYHNGRILLLQASATPGATPGIIGQASTSSTRVDVSYAYTYRSSLTGATSNPSPYSTAVSTPLQANTVSSDYSDDPQVDKVDYYRQDSALANYTYVATGPNDDGQGGGVNTAIVDQLSDTAAADNDTINTDNFEPFPSIDTPKAGVVSVVSGVITWVSGDVFNIRWLPGTVIEIGAPTQLAYTLTSRPTNTTTIKLASVPDGTDLTYNISEPILAAQPLAYTFGPTDNVNYIFGLGDNLRPGTLYWCKGSNLDSAPDTNQMDVTDPGEALVNGAMVGGMGVLFSIRRAWIITANFYNAKATATGTSGSTWTLRASYINRGLFIPRCVAVDGGGNIFFRVDDGVHYSQNGASSKSITDESLYPLFAHEGSTPVAITRNGFTIYPPDDSQPDEQQFSLINGWLYYDYLGIDGNWHTLVFDVGNMCWVLDGYGASPIIHASDEGASEQGVLVGCSDGTLRKMISVDSSAGETPTATIVSAALGGSGWCHLGQMTIEYSSMAAATMTPIAVDSNQGSYYALSVDSAAISLPSTGGMVTKLKLNPAPNKFKLMQFKLEWADSEFQLYLEGCEAHVGSWGGRSYKKTAMFGLSGEIGGEE
jgi:hypothetical protein